jgi:hypothetical protein
VDGLSGFSNLGARGSFVEALAERTATLDIRKQTLNGTCDTWAQRFVS